MTASRLQLDRERFLSDYWQQQPLLIRSALPDFSPPIDADTLAGLALEQDIESRIIEYRDSQWLITDGPFNDADFQRNTPWTLLVQAVDHYIPAVADLRRLIDFIPQWRIDDVMVSYAVPGGSVGPHYDNYDVFLLQGEGRRRWKIGQRCDASAELLPHQRLRILADFQTEQEYLLEPGDILYVPPGVAHWGIAEDECTTFSIGFRAPRLNDMLSRWVDSALEQADPEQFYVDPDTMKGGGRPGEITADSRRHAHRLLEKLLDGLDAQDWFGELVTEPRYPIAEQAVSDLNWKPSTVPVDLAPESKLAWQDNGGTITVFANGISEVFTPDVTAMLISLCDSWTLTEDDLQAIQQDPECVRLRTFLHTQGVIDER